MLIRRPVLERIKTGEVTLTFRRWKRSTVKTGGRLRTAVGELEIGEVRIVSMQDVTPEDAHAAGYGSPAELLSDLAGQGGEGELYRIAFSYAGTDRRAVLRDDADLSEADLTDLRQWLQRNDARIGSPGWTQRTLQLIADLPGRRAQDLSDAVGLEKAAFKIEVRRLKELGLTESLEIGYRISPRGKRLLDTFR